MAFQNAAASETPPAASRKIPFAQRFDQKSVASIIVGAMLALLVLPPLYYLVIGAITVDEGAQTRYTLERFYMLMGSAEFC